MPTVPSSLLVASDATTEGTPSTNCPPSGKNRIMKSFSFERGRLLHRFIHSVSDDAPVFVYFLLRFLYTQGSYARNIAFH